jgi:endonuclease YncB( thermonuclease family)
MKQKRRLPRRGLPRPRPMRPRLTPAKKALMIVAAIIGLRMAVPETPAERQGMKEVVVRVEKVFDGDTFACADGRRVRLLGIDAPEVSHPDQPAEPWSEESAEWLRKRIENQTVKLNIGQRATDRYHRTLAWVYDKDGRLVNLELLQVGAARLLPDFGLPVDLEPALRAAEAEARAASRGLWQKQRRR